jgi:RNA polymerase sigma factor (sigma-70 family)
MAVMQREGATLDDLQEVYERRLGELRRVAAAIVYDRELACDVVQDAFVRAVRTRKSFSGSGALEGWVWRIVVNAARDARARARLLEVVPNSDELNDFFAPDEHDVGQRQAVRAAIERLPERQRLVLFLRVYADLDYCAIADAVGISDGTVAATLNAAQTRLRELLSEVRR